MGQVTSVTATDTSVVLQEYDGFKNWPLDPNAKYKLMMRAFAKEDEHRKQSVSNRAF